MLNADVDGHRVRAVVNVKPDTPEVFDALLHGQRFAPTPPDRLTGSTTAGDGTPTAPMPGTVVDVRAVVRDAVAEGDVLGVLEA